MKTNDESELILMKKILALILLAATLILVLAACVEPEQQEVQSSVSDETAELTRLDAVPDELDFGGEDVVIISRALQGWTLDEVAVPELTSEPVNDAIYNRNLVVSDRLGVNIVSHAIDDASPEPPVQAVRDAVLAGSDEYDLLAGACYLVMYTTLEGNFRDLTQLTYLDLSQNYWTQDYNDTLSFDGKQYSATGMIALSNYRFAFATAFNKVAFDDRSLPYLYEAVDNGEWTLDYQATLSENFYRDLNGNGEADKDDFYGLITSTGISTDPYWMSCDVSLLDKNPDGEYEWVLDIQKLSDVTDKILKLYYESGSYVYVGDDADNEQDEIRRDFAAGNAAMITTRLVAVEQADVRNMKDPYGIVPMPKFDKSQKEYGTLQHDQITVYGIPVTVAENRVEMLGAVLEVMASESARTVKPAYYEVALKRKYMSDPVAWEMLDKIFETVRIDAGVVYVSVIGGPHALLRDIAASKQNTVSSTYSKLAKNIEKSLRDMHEKLSELQ